MKESFASNIFDAFAELENRHGFVRAYACAGTRFASIVRKEEFDVFTYVFASDGRPNGASLDLNLWVAPPDSPDDSLEKIYVGFKIRIGSEFEIDDAFINNCQARVIAFLPCITAIIPIVKQELTFPSIRSKRWYSYIIERRVLALLLGKAGLGDQNAISLIKSARSLVRSNVKSIGRLERILNPFAAELMMKGELDVEARVFFNGDAAYLTSALAQQLYIELLGEMSEAKRMST